MGGVRVAGCPQCGDDGPAVGDFCANPDCRAYLGPATRVVGRPAADARRVLESRGLAVTTQPVRSNALPLDHVLDTDPPAGTVVDPGSEVRVLLARPTQVDLLATAQDAE